MLLVFKVFGHDSLAPCLKGQNPPNPTPHLRKIQHLLSPQRPSQHTPLPVGQPLLQHLIPTQLVAPDGKQHVSPEGMIIEVAVQGDEAKWIKPTIAPAIALRSSGVKGRSTNCPCPGMTELPLPMRSYPAVTAKPSSIEASLTVILLYMICSISLTYYNAIAYAYMTSDAIVKNIDVSIKGIDTSVRAPLKK